MLFLFRMNLDLASPAVSASALRFNQVETSGVVSETRVTTQDLIDHAFRRCTIQPSAVTGENLETAERLLHVNLTRLASKGIAMWAIEKEILGVKPGAYTFPFPNGTVDVLNMNLRTTTRLTGTPSEAVLNDDNLSTSFNYGFSGGTYTLTLSSAQTVTTVGVLAGATTTWNLSVEYTTDGSTWEEAYSDEVDVTDGQWTWFDIESVSNAIGIRFSVEAGALFAARQVYFGNQPREVPLYKMNRTEYSALTDKTVAGRPVQYWLDKQRLNPVANLWPVPMDSMKYYQVTTYFQRHIQDVGNLSQIVEIPRRWYLAVINQLALELAMEMPGVPPERFDVLDKMATRTLAEAWDGETDSSKTRFRFNLRGYNS